MNEGEALPGKGRRECLIDLFDLLLLKERRVPAPGSRIVGEYDHPRRFPVDTVNGHEVLKQEILPAREARILQVHMGIEHRRSSMQSG